jgi:hypothetical protein
LSRDAQTTRRDEASLVCSMGRMAAPRRTRGHMRGDARVQARGHTRNGAQGIHRAGRHGGSETNSQPLARLLRRCPNIMRTRRLPRPRSYLIENVEGRSLGGDRARDPVTPCHGWRFAGSQHRASACVLSFWLSAWFGAWRGQGVRMYGVRDPRYIRPKTLGHVNWSFALDPERRPSGWSTGRSLPFQVPVRIRKKFASCERNLQELSEPTRARLRRSIKSHLVLPAGVRRVLVHLLYSHQVGRKPR